jgi:hypothetical protein
MRFIEAKSTIFIGKSRKRDVYMGISIPKPRFI